ncbi:c-type cytochrome [uncultured Roseovarius sp.]|uniref:c-type cytochrome n=1 Tax=uncultured Roseovarius sp. TaxID=293344 RepID=UPI0026352AFC|nr:c-type cytochrome [uncultured Roseovarius sp.]
MRALVLGLWLMGLAGVSPLAAQEFTTLKGHGGPVMGLSVLPGSGQVVSASFDNSVGLWQGRAPRWFEGHAAAVVTVEPLDEDRVVSGGDDFTVIVWDRTTGEGQRLEGHQGKIAALDVSPDGAWIASASWDGSIGLWPVAGGEAWFLKGHDAAVTDVAFSEDGRLLYSSSADGTLREWQWREAGAPPRELLNQGFGINRIVLGPGDTWLAYGAVDGATRVVDPATGREIADFTLDRRPVLSLAYHAETAQLAAGDGHGYIMVIDTEDWNIARDFQAMARGPVWALEFSPDGGMIYAGGLSEVIYGWPVDLLDDYDPAGAVEHSFLRPADEMENGERQFMRKCSICHALTPPPSRKAGPTLHGIFGRRAGTLPGYAYSDTLDGADIVWSEQTIDALFDLGPDHYIPGSKMPMQRITAPDDRQDMIDYLRRATATEGN